MREFLATLSLTLDGNNRGSIPRTLGDAMFLIVNEVDVLRGQGCLGGNSFRDGPQARRKMSDTCGAASHRSVDVRAIQ